MSPSEIHHHVVVLWRSDRRRLKFTWVSERWGGSRVANEAPSYNASKDALTAALEKLLTTDTPLPYETEVQVRVLLALV